MIGPIGVYPSVEGIEEEPLATDPFCVIVRARHPLARRRTVSLRDLADAQWVLPGDRSAFHRQLEALFVVAGIRWPAVSITTNSMPMIKTLVSSSDSVAIMPRQLVELERRAKLLQMLDLAEAGVSRALGLSWARGRPWSPTTRRFVEILRETAAEQLQANRVRSAFASSDPSAPLKRSNRSTRR